MNSTAVVSLSDEVLTFVIVQRLCCMAVFAYRLAFRWPRGQGFRWEHELDVGIDARKCRLYCVPVLHNWLCTISIGLVDTPLIRDAGLQPYYQLVGIDYISVEFASTTHPLLLMCDQSESAQP